MDFPPELSDSVVQRLAASEAHIETFKGSGTRRCRQALIEPAIEVRFHVEGGTYSERHGQYRFESCDTLLNRLQKASETQHIGAEPWRLEVMATAIRLDNRTIFELPCADTFECGSDLNNWNVEWYSLVGPIVSFAESHSAAGAGGPPYPTYQGFTALDFRDGSRASSAALLSDEAFWKALTATPWIENRLSKEMRSRIDSTESLNDALRDASDETPYLYDSYYFAEWHEASGEVEIHIDMTRDEGPGRLDSSDRVELRLEPAEQYRKYFEAAAEGRGFYRASDRPEGMTLESVYSSSDW